MGLEVTGKVSLDSSSSDETGNGSLPCSKLDSTCDDGSENVHAGNGNAENIGTEVRAVSPKAEPEEVPVDTISVCETEPEINGIDADEDSGQQADDEVEDTPVEICQQSWPELVHEDDLNVGSPVIAAADPDPLIPEDCSGPLESKDPILEPSAGAELGKLKTFY